jgi:hypothetical protein
MRHRLALLLVALLPALIVPAGSLRFCLCESAPTAPECCCKAKCCDEGDAGVRIAAVDRCSGCQELTTPQRNASDVGNDSGKHTLPRLALLASTFRPLALPARVVAMTLPPLPVPLAPALAPPLRI